MYFTGAKYILRQGDFGVQALVPEDVGEANVKEVVLLGIWVEAEGVRVNFVSNDDHVHVV